MKVPLARPVFDVEMWGAALDALWSERLVLGGSVFGFEEEFARCCGAGFAVSTGSGASALHAMLTVCILLRFFELPAYACFFGFKFFHGFF